MLNVSGHITINMDLVVSRILSQIHWVVIGRLNKDLYQVQEDGLDFMQLQLAVYMLIVLWQGQNEIIFTATHICMKSA